MKNVGKGILAFVLLLSFVFISVPLWNNWALEQFSNQLYSFPIPFDSTIISKESECGNLGNGNHLDFKSTIVLETKSTADKLKSHYAKLTIAQAKSGGKTEFGSETERVLQINALKTTDGTVISPNPNYNYYEITIIDAGYESVIDFRAH